MPITTMPKTKTPQVAPSEVIEHLRRLIISKDMQPGERLPSERALAAELRVGRPSVREAIKALQVLDVLDSRHGDGTFIKSRAGLSGGWPSQVDIGDQDFDLIELLEVRKFIEPSAAALAAARRTEKQLLRMEREVLAQEARPDDLDNVVRHDYLFHEEIINAADNRILLDVEKLLAPLLLRSRKLTAETTPDIRTGIQQHRAIWEAIRLRNPELAEQAMRIHLQTTGLDLISRPLSRQASAS